METTNQLNKVIPFFIAIVGLISLPSIVEVYNILLYIIGVIILIILMFIRVIKDKYFEERFYNRWHNSREKGFWKNVICESLRSLVIVTMVVSLTQFLVYGRTPLFIVSKLPNFILIGLILVYIIINFIAGIASWFENERKYKRMLRNKNID